MPEKIKSIIRIALAYTLVEKCNNELQNISSEDDPFLFSERTQLQDEINEFSVVLNQGKVKSILNTLDHNRGDATHGVHLCIQAARYLPDEQIQIACSKFDEILERYPMSILHKAMNEESALLTSMINDFEVPELNEYIDVIPTLNLHLNNLKNRCTEFKEQQEEWLNYNIDKKGVNSATEWKYIVFDRLNNRILPYLNAMVMIKPDLLSTCSTRINTLIKEANSAVKRKKREANTEDSESI